MNNIYIKLAKNNIKNSLELYIPYILSGVMTVAMTYIMRFLANNEGLSKIPNSASLKTILMLGVAVISIFSYIFIFYTNSFIIKKRKKEIGVYNVLGMEKRHISKLLSVETLFVAVVAIFGGIVIGIVFSKLMLMILYKLLRCSETIVFSASFKQIGYTVIPFIILYILTLVYNLMQIKLANPIELLKGGNVGEKEPKAKKFMTFTGCICILAGYAISILTKNPLQAMMLFFVAVMLVIIGTYALFTSGSISLLKSIRKNKNIYYNKKYFTAISGLLYRMKQNAAGLASICVLSTMVLVTVSTTVSLYVGVDDELKARFPYELSIMAEYDKPVDEVDVLKDLSKDMLQDNGLKISQEVAYPYMMGFLKVTDDGFEVNKEKVKFGSDIVIFNVMVKEDFASLGVDVKVDKELKPGEVAVFGSNEFDKNEIELFGNKYSVVDTGKYVADEDEYMISMIQGAYYIIVDSKQTLDDIYNDYLKVAGENPDSYRVAVGFELEGSADKKAECGSLVDKYVKDKYTNKSCTRLYSESRQANKDGFFSVYGGLFFIGIFLGSIFLMVTVMIIFYKQVSEGYDDKQRYNIMEKVGMSSEEVKVSITSQVMVVFFLPLGTAIIHMIAAFPIVKRLLALFNLTNTKIFVICLMATSLVFAVIYYIVYKLTSRFYYKIVEKK